MSLPPAPALVSPDESSFSRVMDPRWLQGAFAVAFLLTIGLLVVGGSTFSVRSLLGVATLLCLAATASAFLVPWDRLPRTAIAVLPVLDIAVIGISDLDPSGWSSTPLLVLPVLWMAGASTAPVR